MSRFGLAEAEAASRLIDLALAEDLSTVGDLTSATIIPPEVEGEAAFVVRPSGVIAGLPVVRMVLERVSPRLQFEPLVADGTQVASRSRVALVRGPMRELLTAERTALNFLQRLSGVATLTRTFVDAVAGLPVQILDTRKTTPGWRLLEKYAVAQGGGTNHRIGLYDGLLIKDNHLACLTGDVWSAVKSRLEAFRQAHPQIPVEIEVDTLEQLEAALPLANIVLLDNMRWDQLRHAVQRRNEFFPQVRLEASGGVNLQTVRGIAESGVDRISIGALTHSAPALDIGLDYVVRPEGIPT
jgi:nicotinate-nucleotide pyrophosphorylase (carboxylating)